jgi:hypothetical protein
MNVQYYLGRIYNNPPCWNLVSEIYKNEVKFEFPVILYPRDERCDIEKYAQAFRIEMAKNKHGFEKIIEPTNYCIVLMSKLKNNTIHHCGVFYNGKIIHATEKAVINQDIFSLRDLYNYMEFWSK